MKFSQIVNSVIAVALVTLATNQATAQLPSLGGSGAAAAAAERAQAATQQRVQAQVQQRAQARVQAQVQQSAQARVQTQVQAQTAARLQVTATRAANIAQRATAIAQRQAASVQQRAAGGVGVRVGANANARSRTQVGDQKVDLATAARLGIDSRLSLPADVTAADVKIYDDFFGRFNPLRPQQTPQASASSSQSAAESGNVTAESSEASRQSLSKQAVNGSADAAGQLDLTNRINVAARQRRAEISEMRDRALATGNAQLMVQADRVETAMNAFVKAQSQTRSKIVTEASNGLSKGVRTASSANARGSVRAGAGSNSAVDNVSNTQTRTDSRANGNATVTDKTNVDR